LFGGLLTHLWRACDPPVAGSCPAGSCPGGLVAGGLMSGPPVVGGHDGECGARTHKGGLGVEPPTGSRGRAPGQGAKPPETESILVIGCPTEPANLAPVRENSMLWCQSWGAHSAWSPQPHHWGPVPPAPPPMFNPGL